MNRQERYLTDTEIVENVIYAPTTIVLWSIHRPKRGWYLRLRAASFPPNVFIHIRPMKNWAIDGALGFVSRTFLPTPPVSSDVGILNGEMNSSSSTVHSYPPTPPTNLHPQPPSPTLVKRKLVEEQQKENTNPRKSLPPSSQISHFVLTPTISAFTQTATTDAATAHSQTSLLSKAMSFWSHASASHASKSHGTSFSLTRLFGPHKSSTPVGGGTLPNTAKPPSIPPPVSSNLHNPTSPFPPQQLLLRYTDQTPVYSMGSQAGLLEIDEKEQFRLGVDTAFWIAVSIAYAGFLSDRESYLAAMND